MKRLYSVILLFCIFLFFHCGSDPGEEGQLAYDKGDYSQAIKLLTRAQQEDSTRHDLDEMICLSYLCRGTEVYEKTHNVKALAGNFEQGEKYLPKKPTGSFNKKYSEFLIQLAQAYLGSKSSNEMEQESYFENAVTTAKKAKQIDSTSTAADSLLLKLKTSHFQNLLDKGKNLYSKAGRTRNPDLYFTSKYYLKKAQEFEADNKEILKYLGRIRSKTFSVLNYREDLSIAVVSFSQERKGTIVDLTIKNYSGKPVSVNIDNFELVDTKGNRYGLNKHEMKKRELFGESCLKNVTLNNKNFSISGIIAFEAPPDIKIAYVNYTIDAKRFARKYFP